MRDHNEFGSMKGTRNPYVGGLKESIAIRLYRPTVAYFKALAAELGMHYQSLISPCPSSQQPIARKARQWQARKLQTAHGAEGNPW